ncbi:universal stress protein [Amycolatopsis keratiniphila]|uniref:universal stress protein n=1 Tax=Amycolatopsis keratiniphila TaxID=129921 RepID=UPI000B33ABE6|nr:universal stress protein [Amycolatopsis keratiniphila]
MKVLCLSQRIGARDKPRHRLLEPSEKGGRGRGGFDALAVGSTSHALIHHAKCPVMIVRETPSLVP